MMDLVPHLMRQMASSRAAFAPGERTAELVGLIRSNLSEILESGGDAVEWAEVVKLALDGLTREIMYRQDPPSDPGWVAEYACALIERRQVIDEDLLDPGRRAAGTKHIRGAE